MQSARRDLFTEEEYLALENASKTRHEFVNGEILAMAGGSERHSTICTNLAIAIGSALRGKPCRIYNSDLRIGVPDTSLYTYPDASVVCGPREFHPNDHNTLINPTLLIEVLSPSSEQYDRGAKFAHYRRLASLKEYMLVSQDAQRVEHYRKLDDGQWLFSEYRSGVVESPAIGCSIALADIYYGIEF